MIDSDTSIDRRRLLKGAAGAGITLLGGSLLAGCGGSGVSASSNNDQQILGAAKIAEALAVTTYTTIINTSPFFAALPSDDQNYFKAARDEEMDHYNLLKSATGGSDAPLTYYFPAVMFTDTQTTLNVLVTLEDAFIGAYLFGVKQLSTPNLRVLAAQIMGIESDHRTLARTVASEAGLSATTGLSGAAESVDPPNNNVYERTYGLSGLTLIVNALKPFFDATAAASASYTQSQTFDPTYVPNFAGLQGNPPG